MTNREILNHMTDDEFAEWLCKQIWSDYNTDDCLKLIRFHMVCNFLKMEHKE